MILIGEIIFDLAEEKKLERDFYSWFSDLFYAGCGYQNFRKVAEVYAREVLNRPIKSSFLDDWCYEFDVYAPLGGFRDFEDIYDLILSFI